MVQIVQGGACQAAGKQPGDFRPAPCSFFLGTHSGERASEGHIFLESWEPLGGRGAGPPLLLGGGRKGERSPGQATRNCPQQTFPGTDLKVCTNAALPQPRGSESSRFSVLAAPGTCMPGRGVLLSLRGAPECVRGWDHLGRWINGWPRSCLAG